MRKSETTKNEIFAKYNPKYLYRLKKKIAKITIGLYPYQLEKNININILKQCKKKFEKKYIQEYGYIWKIINVHSILHNDILCLCPTVKIILNVFIWAFCPQKGDVLRLPISCITSWGIFHYIDNIQFILPAYFLSSFQYNNDDNNDEKNDNHDIKKKTHYISEKENLKITQDDIIPVSLMCYDYQFENYSCIVKLDIDNLKRNSDTTH